MSNNFHLQLYRGTTAQNDAYTGLSGEVTVDTTLSKLRLHDGSTAGGVEIGGMPVGSIIPYAGTTIPAGYLLCDGSAISRTTYSALFASIGTTYGEGDGNSTFNIPNGKVYIGIRAPVSIDTSTIPNGTIGCIGIQELNNDTIKHDNTALYTPMETNVPLPNSNKKLLSLNGSEAFASYVNCHLIVNLNKANLQSNIIIKY